MISQIDIRIGDSLSLLKAMPDESIQMCCTSPPYYQLRRYGNDANEMGQEATPEEYVSRMAILFEEVRRVLRKDGTLWLNIGDSYCGSGKGGRWEGGNTCAPGLKSKDLIGIPWMLAFALRAHGWCLRCDIVWAKSNCMPESVTDRPTRSHEFIFLLSKSERYFYDHEAIKEPCIYDVDGTGTAARKARASESLKSFPDGERNGIRNGGFKDAEKFNGKHRKQRGHSRRHAGFNDRWDNMTHEEQCVGMRNKRDVWTVAPANFPNHEFVVWLLSSPDGRENDRRGIVSPNSQEHGGLFDLLATVFCGEHEDVPLSHTLSTCPHLSAEPKGGFVPIETLRAYCFGGENLDSLFLRHFQIAIPHNNETNKTDLFVSTKLSCMPSSERLDRIARMLTKCGLSAKHLDMLLSNTWPGEMDARLWDQILFYNAGKSLFSSGPVYRKASKMLSHFATFPADLIRPCILAGSKAGDTVLDPFGGSGTVGEVCMEYGRNAILMDLYEKHRRLAQDRCNVTPGLHL